MIYKKRINMIEDVDRIKYINLALTNRCNLRCSMCDIWREDKKIDMPVRKIVEILDSNYLNKELDITFTGGEPFLYPYLFEVTDYFLGINKSFLQTISTNGVERDKIGSFFR
jgi:MoaA/NifB/PqqE/SkfB family radical SAM enzyme